MQLHATPATAAHFLSNGVLCERVPLPRSSEGVFDDPHDPDVLYYFRNKAYDFSIQFPRASNLGVAPNSDNQRIMSKVRRAAIDYNVPLITNLEVAEAFIKSLATVNELNVDSYLDNTDSITKH